MVARLTVTIPTFNSPVDKLDRAVSSVLFSLPDDGRVIVVNDGGVQPSLWSHPRLTVVDLEVNRGRYFADAAVLATLGEEEYWSPHDSDDWSDRDRFGVLLDRAVRSGATVAPMWRHEQKQKPRVQQCDFGRADAPNVRHLAHWCTGVYRVSRVRQAGGLLLSVRTSYDHALLMAIARHGPVTVDQRATYHWERRPNSLTTSRDTAVGSQYRAQERRMTDGLWRLIRDGHDPVEVIADASGSELLAALDVEVSRLSRIL